MQFGKVIVFTAMGTQAYCCLRAKAKGLIISFAFFGASEVSFHESIKIRFLVHKSVAALDWRRSRASFKSILAFWPCRCIMCSRFAPFMSVNGFPLAKEYASGP